MFVLSFVAMHSRAAPAVYFWGGAWTTKLTEATIYDDANTITTIIETDEFRSLTREGGDPTMIGSAFHLAFDGAPPSEITHAIYFEVAKIRLEMEASRRYTLPT